MDDSGSILPHICKIKRRSNYLRANMKYYVRNLTFENQYLIWKIFMRPYFLYASAAISTQTETVQKKFHSCWRNSFK